MGTIKIVEFKNSGDRIGTETVEKISKTEQEWKKRLSAEEYRVTRGRGTEVCGSGDYEHNKQRGIYRCVCCGTALFHSQEKFDSGTGWPSFWQPLAEENLERHADHSLGMNRTEVLCARCDAHLGHVFEDGPRPTGLRYCINSVSLRFEKAE
jgi:peptide-methionine (R)-S-oxide reductase